MTQRNSMAVLFCLCSAALISGCGSSHSDPAGIASGSVSSVGGENTNPSTGGNGPTTGGLGSSATGSTSTVGSASSTSTGATNTSGGQAMTAAGGSTSATGGKSPATGGTSTAPTGGTTATGGTGSAGSTACSIIPALTPSTTCTWGDPNASPCIVPTHVVNSGTAMCARFTDQQVRCWGQDTNGELGDGTTKTAYTTITNPGAFKAELAINLTNVAQLAAGNSFTCALLTDGTVSCWGMNNSAQIGTGAFSSNVSTPTPVAGLSGVTSITSGMEHTCALKSDGTVWCWGEASNGQIGDGVGHSLTSTQPGVSTWVGTPTQAVGVSNATEIYAGSYHTCALISDGTMLCWGDDTHEQLGDVTLTGTMTFTPLVVHGVSGVAHLATKSASNRTCVIYTDGTAACWGDNTSCAFGTTTSTTSSKTPVAIPGLSGITSLIQAEKNTCALKSDGTYVCWGDNTSGQLGTESTASTGCTKVTACGIPSVTSLVTGGTACAILTNGVLACWGYDMQGLVGQGAGSKTPRLIPLPVIGSL